METNDEQLFSKSAPLLSAAAELAYHTVRCSALNAEELRRENGIQVCCLYGLIVAVFLFHLLFQKEFCCHTKADLINYCAFVQSIL